MHRSITLDYECLQTVAKRWEKTLKSFCHESFKKIRINKPPKVSNISELLEKRKSLKGS